MELIADIFLVAGALGAGLYCFVLSRRLKRFTDLEKGVGGAVAVLSAQSDELKKSLESARAASDRSGDTLKQLTQRAETVAQRLELMMASMHDIVPDQEAPKDTASPATEPTVPPEPEVAKVEAAEAPEQKEEPVPEPAEKRTAGPMFMRHGRKRREATA
ncbi:hypothetical protein [Ruegeria lacuscaerulensis]|uniref:hypothetical protein n=1 Tax=Ruegeria lacuscaerulensis TaxID=55218 RepID=UPI0014810F9F|nr:hypothetical protein [Ruegeria lacuscaerulensis]